MLQQCVSLSVCVCALSSPRSARALALPDRAVAAAVVVAVGQLLVGTRGGSDSFGLGRRASAGVEDRAGTGPAQRRLERTGCRETLRNAVAVRSVRCC